DLLAGGFGFVPPPRLSSAAPWVGPPGGGTAVTLAGKGFLAGASVAFDGVPSASVVFGSSTALTAMSPAHAEGAVTVEVTNPDGQSDALDGGFRYALTPSLVALSPALGPIAGGQPVVLSGASFATG